MLKLLKNLFVPCKVQEELQGLSAVVAHDHKGVIISFNHRIDWCRLNKKEWQKLVLCVEKEFEELEKS